jgi:hypothetical protein
MKTGVQREWLLLLARQQDMTSLIFLPGLNQVRRYASLELPHAGELTTLLSFISVTSTRQTNWWQRSSQPVPLSTTCAHPSRKQVKPVSNQCQLVLSEKDDSMMTPALGLTVDATGGPCTQTVKIVFCWESLQENPLTHDNVLFSYPLPYFWTAPADGKR